MLDWTRIEELLAEIGEDDFAEVVALFLEEADAAAGSLGKQPQGTELEEVLHFMKGSALNLGFSDLAQLCAEGERAANRNANVDVGPVISSYQRSKDALIDGLAKRRAA